MRVFSAPLFCVLVKAQMQQVSPAPAEEGGVWSSADLVHAAADRLRQQHFASPVVTLIYPHAGHRAGMPEIIPSRDNGIPHPLTGRFSNLGGTPGGNAA